MKVPSHEFDATVHFYEHILGLTRTEIPSADPFDSVAFAFGDKVLWIDRIAGLSQAETWLELETATSSARAATSPSKAAYSETTSNRCRNPSTVFGSAARPM